MGGSRLKIGVLTSSRADYSVYLPLLKAISAQKDMELNIIAFGTHLLKEYGYTLNAIKADGFKVDLTVDNILLQDSPAAISTNMGNTMLKFAKLWEENKFDLVFALGDRYEMFAAVAASVPFNIPIAHIHGGETTLGAIDNCFRHSITLMSSMHFVSTDEYKKRVVELLGENKHVYNVGALSIENMKTLQLFSKETFFERFNIDLNKPSVLITFHPETVAFEKNETYIKELIAALTELKQYQLVITMPNADTMGNMIRQKLNDFISKNSNAVGIESFGTIGYLTCIKYCSFMLGNTSSGFVEAAFFPTKVINLGSRQKGRIMTPNIINSEIERSKILEAVEEVKNKPSLEAINIYGDGSTSRKIIELLRSNPLKNAK